MPLDGLFLHQLGQEIKAGGMGGRIDKIHQPSREELVIGLRCPSGNKKLLLSAGADSPRLHFIEDAIENPKSPPMFCMLLRKHLSGAKFLDVEQVGLDRILHLRFQATNELGDVVQLTLAVEIMGRHSNIILIDPQGKIIDSVKRVGEEISSVRPILPGMTYVLPPPQTKHSILTCSPSELTQKVKDGRDIPLSKALLEILEGASPLVCREISHYVSRGEDCVPSALSADQWDKLTFRLGELCRVVTQYAGTPTFLADPMGEPKDFSFLDIHQYGSSMVTKPMESYSRLLDVFYSSRASIHRVRHRSNDLLKLLANTSDRIARKLLLQKEELQKSTDREHLRICGDLIQSNLYAIQKGVSSVTLENYYEEELPKLTIQMDPRLSPAENAQRYYQEYHKADTAEKMLRRLIEEGEKEGLYIDSVFDALTRATTDVELMAIREELASQGYLRFQRKGQKPQKLSPRKYLSTDGFTIIVGRNNLQNDQLTLKDSKNYDMWFHTKNIPGSHTVVVADGKTIPQTTLEEAAIIAAFHSRAAESAQVPVDYTIIKNVKKPSGAKPGFVIYETYQTAFVTPNKELVESLEVK